MTIDAIYIPFPRSLYNDIIQYTSLDPVDLAQEQVWDFLERTLPDAQYYRDAEHFWEFAETHFPEEAACIAKELDEKPAITFKPLVWKEVTIDNGTEVRMQYGGNTYYAKVKSGKITDDDGSYSPSEWASKIAGGTSRNAWRDLWFKEILAKTWVPATLLRAQAKELAEKQAKERAKATLKEPGK
jgi:hypothetical protein